MESTYCSQGAAVQKTQTAQCSSQCNGIPPLLSPIFCPPFFVSRRNGDTSRYRDARRVLRLSPKGCASYRLSRTESVFAANNQSTSIYLSQCHCRYLLQRDCYKEQKFLASQLSCVGWSYELYVLLLIQPEKSLNKSLHLRTEGEQVKWRTL